MFDCSQEILSFHNNEVRLSQKELAEIRKRKDINRRRILRGLNYYEHSTPYDFFSQGSYAMKTMIRHEENDYDIDDGVYFDKEQLSGPRGGEMSALDARKMVWWAIHSDNFNTPPDYLKNCVRVYFNEGYCIDVPVYRRVLAFDSNGKETTEIQLASTTWKRSDPRKVTEWFENENNRQSPDLKNGKQLRRICRLLKKFARSRGSWRGRIASGFVITKLTTECFHPTESRDDLAFYQTAINLYQRLHKDLTVCHPVITSEYLSHDKYDPQITFFRDKLYEALIRLSKLNNLKQNETKTLRIWNRVFNTNYFID